MKRGPGRPRKQPVAEDAHPPRGPGRPPKQPTAQEAKTSRGPGRPPKQPITEDAKPARGPGRPPKQSITDYAKPPQDPGRPVKQPIVEDAKPPRGPGRPRKQPNTEEGTIPRGPSRPSMLTLAPEVSIFNSKLCFLSVCIHAGNEYSFVWCMPHIRSLHQAMYKQCPDPVYRRTSSALTQWRDIHNLAFIITCGRTCLTDCHTSNALTNGQTHVTYTLPSLAFSHA